tara:strand:- start:982 stop:1764 length:783 start_codon:yes stop_codon:yes gene_type:complete
MIGFNYLGQHGRLANQMFQYASLRGIAAFKGYDFCIPKTDYGDKWKDNKLFDVFEMKSVKNIGFIPADFYPEKQFHYDPEYVDNCPDNVNLHGYYQSEKYFKHIEDSIREDFKFKEYILEPCVTNFDFDNIIALHVRRTDYVSNSLNHPLCDLSYYERALENFDSDIPVMIFSDDVGWCQSQKLFESDRFIISESNNGFIDLCLMSMCHYHIIANSSFSWWGAWLAKSKKVIAPLQWFGTSANTSKNQTQDLYLDEWIKI